MNNQEIICLQTFPYKRRLRKKKEKVILVEIYRRKSNELNESERVRRGRIGEGEDGQKNLLFFTLYRSLAASTLANSLSQDRFVDGAVAVNGPVWNPSASDSTQSMTTPVSFLRSISLSLSLSISNLHGIFI